MYRIFLVEDDPIIAQTVQQHLESWGWQVKAAADFADVMTEFAAFDPQLVLLDIGLPVYNGYHWCGEIRKVSRVPVIFLSSASDNMNIVMAMHMGGDDFIPKPFDLNVLTAKVQALLRRIFQASWLNLSPSTRSWYCWTSACLYTMVSTGAVKYARSPKCR